MDMNSAIAAQSYSFARPATAPKPETATPQDLLSQAASSFVATLKHGEETALASMTGQADAHALVQALAATELAVETAVTLRDRVVEAYQEILRMPV